MPHTPASTQRTPEVVFDATSLGSPLVLDKGWRVGISANPAVAMPEFDDSPWVFRDAGQSFADVPDEDHAAGTPQRDARSGPQADSARPRGHHRPFAWFRLHLKLAPNHGPIFLLVELPVSQNASMGISTQGPTVDVFANGKQIQPEGPHGDSPENFQAISRIYNLNLASSETSLTLVLRSIYVFATRKLRLGNREDLDRSMELWSIHSLFERLPRLVNAILLVVLALFLLALYFTQKGPYRVLVAGPV
jgi:hypothetical protein